VAAHHHLLARPALGLIALTSPEAARTAATASGTVAQLDEQVAQCFACPRLVQWREQVARDKRRSFADEQYWGLPVPGFGDPQASILIVGLAPAAHGANRTGRMFTGDRSGDWLYAALHRAGLASQPTSQSVDDGLALRHVRVTAAVHCAPPGNQPTPRERDACAPWLDADLRLTPARVIVALGSLAWTASFAALSRANVTVPRPRPRFTHGAEASAGAWSLVGSYHPSQQNTFTGKLTEPMLDAVLARAKTLAGPDA
jgi:uracil-DNA glycosylase family 4